VLKENEMTEKFDPAPFDKYAADPKEAAKADRQKHSDLKSGLDGTFPASDPVSATQPGKSTSDSHANPSLWHKIAGVFR
jgi:hypothetical protein